MKFTYGVERDHRVEKFAPAGEHFDHENLTYFRSGSALSGRVEYVNGPVSHVRTDGGRLVKAATVTLISCVK